MVNTGLVPVLAPTLCHSESRQRFQLLFSKHDLLMIGQGLGHQDVHFWDADVYSGPHQMHTPTMPSARLLSGVGLATWSSLPLRVAVQYFWDRVSDKNRGLAQGLRGFGSNAAGAYPLIVNRRSI